MNVKIKVESKEGQALTFVTQGIKRGRRPNNGFKTLGGGNGSFRQMLSKPADIIVHAEMPNGVEEISFGQTVRNFFDTGRLTKKLRDKVVAAAPATIEIETDKNGNAIIPDAAIDNWLSSVQR